MTEQDGPFESSSEKQPNDQNPEQSLASIYTSICRIIPGEEDPYGAVFAETLYHDNPSASDAEEDDVEDALVGYDPRNFPEDIKDEILAGKPFEVTSIQIQSPDNKNIVDIIEIFSLVKE